MRISVDNSHFYSGNRVYLYQCNRLISPEDNSGSCVSGDPPLLGLQREHARLYKCLQSLLQRPATHGRMADVAMEDTVPGIVRHPYLVRSWWRIYRSNLSCFLEELENWLDRGVIEGINRLGSVPPLEPWRWDCAIIGSILGFGRVRVATIGPASPSLVRPRGLILEVELDLQLSSVPGLGHFFPCGDRGDPEPVPHVAPQALSAKLHLFFLRETSPGSPSGTAEPLDVLSDRLSFLLFYGGESDRGHLQIAVGEPVQKPSFEVVPGLDAPGSKIFEPFESDSLEGPEE